MLLDLRSGDVISTNHKGTSWFMHKFQRATYFKSTSLIPGGEKESSSSTAYTEHYLKINEHIESYTHLIYVTKMPSFITLITYMCDKMS